jgi:lipoprotein NlpD
MSRACLIAVIVALAGCATHNAAPVLERAPFAPPPAPAPAAEVPAPSPVEVAVPTYTVKRGDTLYLIALDKGLAYRDLAAWNNIDNPNVIRVGQVLRLAPPGAVSAQGAAPGLVDIGPSPGVTTTPLRNAPAVTELRADSQAATPAAAGSPLSATPATPGPTTRTSDNYKSAPKAVKETYSTESARDFPKTLAAANAGAKAGDAGMAGAAPASTMVARAEPSAKPAAAGPTVGSEDDRLDWMWPAKGKVVGTFSDNANLKGIDISGSAGAPVVASAAGRIVYAGNGLRGYGKLVIIKHNETYLTAYAHNSEIAVKEGDQVARGQKIAEMGNSDADQVILHFEIRRQGKPMDPLKYLPAS